MKKQVLDTLLDKRLSKTPEQARRESTSVSSILKRFSNAELKSGESTEELENVGNLEIQQSSNPAIQQSNLEIQQPIIGFPAIEQSNLEIQQSTLEIEQSGNPAIQTEYSSRGSVAAAERNLPSRQGKANVFARLDADLVYQFTLSCAVHRRKKEDALDEALRAWISSNPAIQQSGNPAIQQSTINNKDTLLAKNYLLGIYSKLTGRKVTEKEEKAFAEIAHYSSIDIELGIFLAKDRADRQGQKINGFRYCHIAIRQAAESSMALFEKQEQLEDLRFRHGIASPK